MQTRSSSRLVSNPSSNPTPSTNPNLKGRNHRRSKPKIEEFNLDELSPPIVTMADQPITIDNFELKHGLLTLVQNKQFFRHDKEDPHAHIRYFNKITSTLKFPNVSNTSIKLMLFPFSLEGAARIWLEKEPSRSIFTWDDLVLKFINQFFPLSKTTNLRNEITNFQQSFDESFSEAWDKFKDLFRACPHHNFSELHQLDTFYNSLNLKDQDSLKSAAGGIFLDKMPHKCLAIIESKSKVRYLRNKPVVAKVSTNTATSGISPDVAELKDMVKALLLDKKSQNQALATMKAVEESCVTYGGAHSYRNCPATDCNVYRDNIQEFVSQAFTVNYNQGNTSYRPPMMSNQIRPPDFPPVPNNQNAQLNQRNNQNRFNQNQNQGNNFNHGPVYQPPVLQPPAYQAPAYQALAPQTQGSNRRRSKQRIEEFNLDKLSPPIVTMADQRTIAQLLQVPTEGYEDAIFVPAITADNFKLKHGLLTHVQNKHEAWDRFKDLLLACPHHGFSELHQLDTFYNALNSKDHDSLNSAAGGNFLDKMPRECLAIIESKSKVRYSHNKPLVTKVSTNTSTSGISADVAELKDMVKALLLDKKSQNQLTNLIDLITKFVNSNSASTSSSSTLPSNTIANPISDLKAITTRSGVSYDGPQIPPPLSFLPKVVENVPEATKDTVHPTNNESTKDVQPQVVQSKSPVLTSEPVTSPISEPVIAPVSAPKPNLKTSIPYPSRRNDERNHEKANNQIEKFYQIFTDMCFEISFADALIPMPKFTSTRKALIRNKEKLSEMAQTLLNEHCSTVLLRKLPKKLGDPGKFLTPCDFPRMAECLALADLELADRSISRPVGVAEDVYVKVGSFHFLADFVVVDFDADPRVPLILGRLFLKTGRALIDVFEGELTLRSSGFFDVISSGNPTSYYDPIIFTTSPTLTPFKNSDFLLEEVDAFLAIEDDPTSPKVYQPYLDPEGELKICEAKSDKSLIDEPSEVELKDLPTHLEYAFLEGDDKLPVIIMKDLSVEEKTALITVLKSHKRAIAWKLSDIKGTFQRCMMAIFYDMIKKTMEVFMDDFSVFGNSFQSYLSHLERMLMRCEDTNLCLNWEKSHFMVKEGIVLGHKISKQRIKVDKAKVDVITKLPHPTTVKGIRSFLGHAGFCRHFIKDFSKIARPMTRILEKDTPFIFSKERVKAF
nr:hypothetical protein [Tanacetum cinerariifolium]